MQSSATPSSSGSKVSHYLSITKTFLNNFPIFTRFLIVAPLVICIIGLVFDSFSSFLINIPSSTLGSLQIHRLFSSSIAGYYFLTVLFGLIASIPTFSVLENEWGTIKLLVSFVWKGLIANLIFALIFYPLDILPFLNDQTSYGPWVIFFVHITEQCLQDHFGTPATLYHTGHTVNIKIYLAVVLFAFWFVSTGTTTCLVACVLTGFLHFKFLNKFFNVIVDDDRIARWESSRVFSWLKKIPNYAPAKSSQTIQPAAPAGGQPGIVIGGEKPPKGQYETFDEENTASEL